ncbi:4Fe-4S binding protein [Thiobacillus denitrificans]|uniref:Regulator of nitric oxide reductase transcription n=1 Tax=Thiobacillus denitrificans TaxID=36861 RepID=A0A125BCC7_THIDE|nr:4Fe-4S binding protein [Thiobacillus denitrificans]KVW95087.1 regulator of nitric oxide reductase transcription [Thiobacillus denitrificans]
MDTLAKRHSARSLWALLLCLMLLLGAMPVSHADFASAYPQVRELFPAADHFGEPEGSPPASAVHANNALIGYAFLTGDMVRIPAYSGSPVNILAGIDTQGRIAGARIVHHEEPILGAGIREDQLLKFVDQYRGKPGRIVVGTQRDGYASVDAIAGATISIMVINATITRAVGMVAESRGIRLSEPGAPAPPATPAPAVKAEPAIEQRTVHPAPTAPTLQLASATSAPAGLPAPASGLTPFASEPEEPIWLALWQTRKGEIAVLVAGLVLLTFILLFQDYLARRPVLLHRIRTGFLVYTLFFIGWFSLGQLSIINVLTFVRAVTHDFSWDIFLIDPTLFILWSFVAVTLLLWGRGVYCGWLCPFGALQELAFQLARRFRLPFFEIPHVVHERLLTLKFVILLVLFGLSLQSIGMAIRAAEIEPFKTAITLRFQREWGYVTFALGILLLSIFNRKFYCKYICPLGASLVIPGRFHSFEWLRRRKECGRPCQACAVECEVQAIRPTGEIVINECHHCLDCQITYYNNHKCPPLAEKRRRRERGSRVYTPPGGTAGISDASRLHDIPVLARDGAADDSDDADPPCWGCRGGR